MVRSEKPTLGERNRNPMNVKDDLLDPWQGSIGIDDKGHAIFRDESWSVRAAVRILSRYCVDYGFKTLREVFGRYAPTSDGNQPDMYANFVSGEMNFPGRRPLNLFRDNYSIKAPVRLRKMIALMAEYENYRGYEFPKGALDKGIEKYLASFAKGIEA